MNRAARLLRTRARRGFSLVELVMVSLIIGVVALLMGRFFINYFASYRESGARMRLQRDMRTLTYWIRTDLTGMPQRAGNFDLAASGNGFAFLTTDDPNNAQDWGSNTGDNGIDSFTYTFSGNRATRRWDPLGTMAATTHDIMLESIEPARGDTVEVTVVLHTSDGDTLARTDFDGTLGNFERTDAVRRVDIRIAFYKKPTGFFSAGRPFIVERGEIESVALYRRGT